MPQLIEDSPVQVPGKRYIMRNISGVYDCSCIAWKMQRHPIDLRTCKHLCVHMGVESERMRVGNDNMPTRFKHKAIGTNNVPKAAVARKLATPAPAGLTPVQADQVVSEIMEEDKNYPCLLANTWKDQDPTGYWISEKLDGVRAIWTGQDFRTRNDNVLFAPDWFKAAMPAERLDGELWLARDMFEETISIVRRHAAGDRWKDITYRVFDVQDALGSFEDRQAHLRGLTLPAHVQVLLQTKCTGRAHLDQELAKVVAIKGEGLMLRKPGSFYEYQRSSTLLKVKPFYDMEVVVTGYTAGKGKYKGVTGALVCDLDGKSFKVGGGLKDKERANPPSVGTIITIKYQQLTKKGIPRHASFVRPYTSV